ncbi:MAG: methyltransferase domain-containing protein [Methanomicrobiales archaeon]|nr:methyltransferase domain-containing protein [Methanomicrobiales archaeon]
MIEEGRAVMLAGSGRTFFVEAGPGKLGTDLGEVDLSSIVGKEEGSRICTHLGHEFVILSPRPTDLFSHAARSGAPMLPRDIGMVMGLVGMNCRDTVLDAGTGSGIAAIFFGGVAKRVVTYERNASFVRIAEKNIKKAALDNTQVVCGDMLDADGTFDVVHLDMSLQKEHIVHAHEILRPGGYLACYTPFLEQTFIAMEEGARLFREVETHECIDRELTRSPRGTRPSTRVCHTGFITVARK